MFQLLERHYDRVSREQFEEDLAWKDRVVLLRDEIGEVQGFTTVAINPAGTCGADYDLFYSGDTIVAREHWGSQELVHGFSRAAGEAKRAGRRLIWLLLSKGHRTYRYLTLFARRYYPALEPERQDPSLEAVVAEAAGRLFGSAWNPESGVVRFAQSHGQLKRELIDSNPWNRQDAFFQERNPGFAAGDELVCAAELSLENLRRHVRRGFEEGMKLRESAVS